jgi:serine protease Do
MKEFLKRCVLICRMNLFTTGDEMRKWFMLMMISSVILSQGIGLGKAQAASKQSIPDLFERVSPSVVYISAVILDPSKVTGKFSFSVGSGFIISADGLVLTNSHLVFSSKSIMATLDGGETIEAILVGADPVLDVALLRIPLPSKGIRVAALGDSDKLRVGEEVIAIGNPLGFEKTLSRGIVSGTNGALAVPPMSLKLPLIQTDAAIHPGSSGGPLMNLNGEVVGITSLFLADAEGIGFALPINIVKKILPQLIDSGRVIRPWLGIHGKLLIAKELKKVFSLSLVDGFLIEAVDSGSPAENAGIQGGRLPVMVFGDEFMLGGDIIFSINGKSLGNGEEFESFLDTMKVGDKVRLGIYREGKRSEVVLTVSERPPLPWDLSFQNQPISFLREKFGPVSKAKTSMQTR